MIQVKILFILLALLLVSCQNSEKSNLTLFSDQIPVDTPLVFGPDIISIDDAMEFAITFNPEMDEMYFTRRKPGEDNEIYTMKLIDGKWTAPEVTFFSASKGWDFEPHINPTGDILYLEVRDHLTIRSHHRECTNGMLKKMQVDGASQFL